MNTLFLLSVPAPHAFRGLDWAVIAVYAAILLAIGSYYSRRQRTTEEYFVGGRRTNPILAGISLFAATTSIISYIGNPGEYVQYGPIATFLVPLATLPFYYLAVGWLLIPVIMRLPITSAYELLEARLGRRMRQTGSLVYVIPRLIWLALILHISAIVLVDVIGCDPRRGYLFAFATGAVTTTYTLFGGLRTVMVTQVIQACLLLMGALLTIASISVRLGGVAAWWPTHWESHWAPQPFFSIDPHVRVTMVSTFIAYLVGNFCITGTDQVAIQRFLTTRDAPAARRAFLLNNVATGMVTVVLGLVGAALLGFYRLNPEAIPRTLTLAKNGDAFFPLYIGHYLPAGVSGLLVACLLASAMSVLASSINATVTVLSEDFVEISPTRGGRTEAAKMRSGRLLTLGVGAAIVVASLGMGLVRGDIVEVATKTVNLVSAPLFGLFFFGMFLKFATPFGAILGGIYGTGAAVTFAFWDVFTGSAALSFLWIFPVSLVVTLVSGCLFSLLPTRRRSPAAIAAYAAGTLAPLAAFFCWMISYGK